MDKTLGEKGIRIVQISDTHLFSNVNKELLGVKPNLSFQSIIELIRTDPIPPQVIIHSGDIIQDDKLSNYAYFAEAMKPFNCPIYYVPGNHDLGSNEIFKDTQIKSDKFFKIGKWQFLLLNSKKPKFILGELSTEEFLFLEKHLKDNPNNYFIIVLHHNPVSNGRKTSDKSMLQNAEKFWEIVGSYENVKVVLSGHIHQDFHSRVGHINYYSCPSTWVQFDRRFEKLTLEKLPQGYRWIDLFDDGSFKTGVRRLKDYIGTWIEKPKAY